MINLLLWQSIKEFLIFSSFSWHSDCNFQNQLTMPENVGYNWADSMTLVVLLYYSKATAMLGLACVSPMLIRACLVQGQVKYQD